MKIDLDDTVTPIVMLSLVGVAFSYRAWMFELAVVLLHAYDRLHCHDCMVRAVSCWPCSRRGRAEAVGRGIPMLS
jgi:hypothetical protein